MHHSEIKVNITLDDDRVPEKMDWSANDGGVNHAPTKAAILSVWDHKTMETLKIDLWTKDMPVDQMKKFLHQNIMAIADTLEKAADEKDAANDLRKFAVDMGKKLKVIS